ncbi:ABC transporter substrate-binding protein [Halothermothrix orenii]|uniref:Extracellular solute-binding protein family 1 n=1 Tax=Halothermothrix orenii (strain H 168 / OCM 544 / DSM 9562) TaxID=373903 RepID=B8D1L8_HALOH|nr:sugar ABC transporter substrate-binding protein [Halothermothrix orenii]ACL69095.1 extracellular solute-binding protein family 1 [Halothermothrix orenii H 168]
MVKKTFLLMLVALFLVSLTAVVGAAEFDWKRFEGETIKLLLNKHPYTDGVLKELDKFEKMTGINVEYDILPEEQYFNKVTVTLSSGSSEYDIFMTGAYQVWQYAPPGWMEPLDKYIEDNSLTSPDWDKNDFIPGIINSLKWNLQPGSELGTGKQWALPLGWEENCLVYRKDIFEKYNLKVPETLDEVIEVGKIIEEKTDLTGIVVRGTRSWATIHPGFYSGLVASGGFDYDGNLKPQMNSEVALEFTKKWVEMIKEVGPEQWTTYTWYDVSNALGSGKAAMMYDADTLGFWADHADERLAWAPGPGLNKKADKTNVWIWSLAMSAHSNSKEPAWYFLQWVTGKEFLTTAAVKHDGLNPVRKSIWENPDFKERLAKFDGYYKTYKKIDEAAVQFTPQPMFFQTTTEWAAALQKIVNGEDAEEVLNKLVEDLDKKMESIRR